MFPEEKGELVGLSTTHTSPLLKADLCLILQREKGALYGGCGVNCASGGLLRPNQAPCISQMLYQCAGLPVAREEEEERGPTRRKICFPPAGGGLFIVSVHSQIRFYIEAMAHLL